MISRKNIFLTGITGAVGSWIASEALKRENTVFALMRDKNVEDAQKRINRILNITGSENYVSRVNVVKGNICDDISGISQYIKNADISMVFHCAASTEFGNSNAAQSSQTNVEGTKNILKLTAKIRVPLCYLSTAYIAGKRNGVVKENEIDIGQSFNNIYEETKCEAEKLVHRWAKETSLPAFIFRPGIVIGDSKRGRIATFNGIYNIMRFFDTVGEIAGNEEIRAVGNVNVTKNLVPVDYLAKSIWYIIEHCEPNTFHITSPRPLTLGQLREIYASLFKLNAKLVTEEEFQLKKPTRMELLYRKASSLYNPYMADEPVFDRTNADSAFKHTNLEIPVIDINYFERLLRYAKSVEWGRAQSSSYHLSGKSLAIIEKYFDDFLEKKKNKQLLPNLRRLSASFRIVLKEKPDEHWALAISKGVLTDISRNGMSYQCSFLVDKSAFVKIASGETAPQQAFFKKQVDIEGDIETGLKLVAALASFFKKYPYKNEMLHD